jgi:hypothetical protein
MKKNFPLHVPGKADARVLDGIKSDIRRYVKRERRKPVPAGVDFWDVDCAVGPDAATATPLPLDDVGSAIDAVVATGVESVYVQILAKPGVRVVAPKPLV